MPRAPPPDCAHEGIKQETSQGTQGVTVRHGYSHLANLYAGLFAEKAIVRWQYPQCMPTRSHVTEYNIKYHLKIMTLSSNSAPDIPPYDCCVSWLCMWRWLSHILSLAPILRVGDMSPIRAKIRRSRHW